MSLFPTFSSTFSVSYFSTFFFFPCMPPPSIFFFFFFNDPPPPEIYPLSLHDALPIFPDRNSSSRAVMTVATGVPTNLPTSPAIFCVRRPGSRPFNRGSTGNCGLRRSNRNCQSSRGRSEEHTSELQSPDHLLCRLLL